MLLLRPAMSNPRPSRRFCAAQFRFSLLSKYLPILILTILNLTFLMQVVFSATLSHLLPLQLGFERFLYLSLN